MGEERTYIYGLVKDTTKQDGARRVACNPRGSLVRSIRDFQTCVRKDLGIEREQNAVGEQEREWLEGRED